VPPRRVGDVNAQDTHAGDPPSFGGVFDLDGTAGVAQHGAQPALDKAAGGTGVLACGGVKEKVVEPDAGLAPDPGITIGLIFHGEVLSVDKDNRKPRPGAAAFGSTSDLSKSRAVARRRAGACAEDPGASAYTFIGS